MTLTLEFIEETHEYRLDGVVVPGVTQILDAFGMRDTRHCSETARAIGEATHKCIHYLNEDDLDWKTLDPAISGHVQAYINFKAETGFRSLLAEQQLAHPIRRYAGTLDDFGWLHDCLTLIDYKTGAPAPWHALQLAGYHELVSANATALGLAHPSELPAAWVVVHLREDGTYQIRPIATRADFRRAHARFLALVDLYHFRGSYIHD